MLWIRKLEYAFSDPTERVADAAGGKAVWTRTKGPAIKLWEDNKACIKWVKNPCAHSRTKHIDVPLKSLREEIQEVESIDVEYIDTTRQLADVLTKSLSPKVHWRLVSPMLGVPIPSSAAGDFEVDGKRIPTATVQQK